ncbi:hypothetical protein [Veronia pacifica]|nr:hypothetical protein [Veronia pacifica]
MQRLTTMKTRCTYKVRFTLATLFFTLSSTLSLPVFAVTEHQAWAGDKSILVLLLILTGMMLVALVVLKNRNQKLLDRLEDKEYESKRAPRNPELNMKPHPVPAFSFSSDIRLRTANSLMGLSNMLLKDEVSPDKVECLKRIRSTAEQLFGSMDKSHQSANGWHEMELEPLLASMVTEIHFAHPDDTLILDLDPDVSTTVLMDIKTLRELIFMVFSWQPKNKSADMPPSEAMSMSVTCVERHDTDLVLKFTINHDGLRRNVEGQPSVGNDELKEAWSLVSKMGGSLHYGLIDSNVDSLSFTVRCQYGLSGMVKLRDSMTGRLAGNNILVVSPCIVLDNSLGRLLETAGGKVMVCQTESRALDLIEEDDNIEFLIFDQHVYEHGDPDILKQLCTTFTGEHHVLILGDDPIVSKERQHLLPEHFATLTKAYLPSQMLSVLKRSAMDSSESDMEPIVLDSDKSAKEPESLSSLDDTMFDLMVDHIHGVNLGEGVQRLGGNKTKYLRVLLSFLNNQSDQMIFALTEPEKGENIMYACRETAENVGAEDIAQQASLLENKYKEGQKVTNKELQGLMELINHALADFNQVVNSTLDHIEKPQEPAAAHEPLEQSALDMLKELEESLHNYDVGAQDKLADISKSLPDWVNQMEEFRQLQEAVNKFDFSIAESHLKHLRDKAG